jgi:hypothetical protein
MIQTTVDTLFQGDIIRFSKTGEARSVASISPSPLGEELRIIDLTNGGRVTMPLTAVVQAEEQWRIFALACLLCKKPQDVQHNLANGGVPRAVICHACDEATTDEVFRLMKEA